MSFILIPVRKAKWNGSWY